MNIPLINKKNKSHHRPVIIGKSAVFAAAIGITLLAACSDKQQATIKTAETEKAKAQVEQYNASGSKEDKLEAERAFADLDKEIKELEVRVDATSGEARSEAQNKLDDLRKRKIELRVDFTKAKFNALLEDIKSAVR
jgi:uncharacterized protein HemX